MGTIQHEAVIVVGERPKIEDAHELAKSLYLLVSEVCEGRRNGYCSFLIAPEGSKVGWDAHIDQEKGIEDFLGKVRKIDHITTCWVSFGDYEGRIRHE